MRKNKMRFWIAALGSLAVALALLYIARLIMDTDAPDAEDIIMTSEDSKEHASSPTAGETSGEAAEGGESPRSAETPTQQTPKTDTAAQPHPTTPYLASDVSELKYKTLDATLDEYARLMLIEYDRLLGEGVKEINARMQAFLSIQERIVANVNPELTTAMIFFQDQRTVANYNATSMLVRAGRLPPTAQGNVFELPNGEIYTIETPHTEVVVRYQRKPKLSESGRLKLENLRSREMDILERMATGDLSLEAEWQDVRAEIERMETRVKNKTLSIRWGHKEHPDFKTIVLDLGIIQD